MNGLRRIFGARDSYISIHPFMGRTFQMDTVESVTICLRFTTNRHEVT